jgi:hypothetical protein
MANLTKSGVQELNKPISPVRYAFTPPWGFDRYKEFFCHIEPFRLVYHIGKLPEGVEQKGQVRPPPASIFAGFSGSGIFHRKQNSFP